MAGKRFCQLVGAGITGFGLYLMVWVVRVLDLSQPLPNPATGQASPALARVPGGLAAAALLALPCIVFGLRLVLKPVGLNEPIGRRRLLP